MNVLLAQSDATLRELLSRSLRQAGHRVTLAATAEETRRVWPVAHVDAAILDLAAPLVSPSTTLQPDGQRADLDLLREARARGDATPVLVLTAHAALDDRLAGLNAGADDYVVKPFDLDELHARLRALERRSMGVDVLSTVGELTLDRTSRTFSIGGTVQRLTSREFELLWLLMTPPGRPASKHELAARLSFDSKPLHPDSVEVYVFRLRKRLAGSGVRISCHWKQGYLLEAEPGNA